jgi:hypothetical protein
VYAADRVPGVRRVPVLKLLLAAELALLAHDHVTRLSPQERRRLLTLIGHARGRRHNLTPGEREELATLIARMEPRILFGRTVDRLSPLPVPERLLYGPRPTGRGQGSGMTWQPVRRPTALEWSRRKMRPSPRPERGSTIKSQPS